MKSTRSCRPLLVTVACFPALTGCGFSLVNIDPPGAGPDGPVYSIEVEFADALSLPRHGLVKQDGVVVGEVTEVRAESWRAHVTLSLRESVAVPANTTARIRQTSPLGETFVALDTPAKPAADNLSAGDLIPIERTDGIVAIEDMLALMSTVTSGATLDSIHTIVSTLGTALEGRTDNVRSLLERADAVLGNLVTQRADLNSLLVHMADFTSQAAARRQDIFDAIDNMTPVVNQLAAQTDDIVGLLTKMHQLSNTSMRVINATRGDIISALRDAEPVLEQLGANEARMRTFMELLVKFAPLLERASPGDFTNVDVIVTLSDKVSVPGLPLPQPLPIPNMPVPTLPPLGTLPGLPSLGTLLGLPRADASGTRDSR